MKTKKPAKIFIDDVKCEAEWKSFTKTYDSRTDLYIGNIFIASYKYNKQALEKKYQYIVTSEFKGVSLLKVGQEYASTVSEAQDKCIEIAKEFCKQLQS